MSDEIEPLETPVDMMTDDDKLQINEFDAILSEAVDVDGGTVGESGLVETTPENQGLEIETSELLFPIISMGFDIVVPDWKVKEKEKKALAEAYGALLDKYFPDAGEYFGAEITALMVTGMVCMPRVMNKGDEKEVNSTEKPKAKPKPQIKADFSDTSAFEMGEITLD